MRQTTHYLWTVFATILAVVGCYCALSWWTELRLQRRTFEEREAIFELLEDLPRHPPERTPEQVWREACVITVNGFGNACSWPSDVSLDEWVRLKRDIATKLGEPPTPETLRWIWHRVGETGPRAKEYVERMTPLLDDAILQVNEANERDCAKKLGCDPGIWRRFGSC